MLNQTEAILRFPDTANFYIKRNKVIVELSNPQSHRQWDTFFLGPVLNLLCMQNGFLAIHASAVSIGGATVLFAGGSGQGKSTIASWLRLAGCETLSDDLSIVEIDPQSHSPLLSILLIHLHAYGKTP